MRRHLWSKASFVEVGRARRISYCLRGFFSSGWCLCRRYSTRAGTILGYLPLDRSITQGLLRRAPRCRSDE